jgi:hypothetical protein
MKNLKSIPSPLLLLAALLLFSGLVSASVSPKVQLANYSLSEVPASPGHVLYLILVLKSLESDNCADRLAVQVTTAYPLSVQGTETQYLEHLCVNDAPATGTFTFALPVDNLASSGTYSVAVATTYEKRFSKYSESNTINVRVGGAPKLIASIASSNPVDIYPGDAAAVTVAIDNTGNSIAQSVRATFNSDSPLEVKWAGADQPLSSIPARASTKATFSIEAPKDLPAGNYPVHLHLGYADESGSGHSSDFNFMVPVKPKAEFEAAAQTSGLLAGTTQEVNIQLTNTGHETARKIKVRIQPLAPFSTDGAVRYIESLPVGASANLTYALTTDKDALDGQQLLTLQMNFEDPTGKKFSDSADFAMMVREPTPTEEVYKYWYVLVIALVVVFMLLRRAMGKKKENGKK